MVSNYGGSRSIHLRNNVGYCHSLSKTFGTASFDCDCPSAACDSSLLRRYVSSFRIYTFERSIDLNDIDFSIRCAGRCLGAVVGAYINFADEDIVESLRFVYRCMAIAAAIVAALYFVLYHGLLKPRCHAHTIQGPRQPLTIVQGKRYSIIHT